MIELGKTQTFTVDGTKGKRRILRRGEESVLLSSGEGKDLKDGDRVEAFVYEPEEGIAATLKTPKIQVGEVRPLQVVSKTKFGAFVDIGLDKDVLCPFDEQAERLREGNTYLFYMYEDRSGRLAVSNLIKERLKNNSPYKKGDEVEGVVYHHKRGLGYFIAVDGKYDGMIPEQEMIGIPEEMETVKGRVINILPDGKLTVTSRERAKVTREKDSEKLEKLFGKYKGVIPVGDKSSPDKIRKVTGLSKKAFKRAAGTLYREQRAIPYPDKLVQKGKRR